MVDAEFYINQLLTISSGELLIYGICASLLVALTFKTSKAVIVEVNEDSDWKNYGVWLLAVVGGIGWIFAGFYHDSAIGSTFGSALFGASIGGLVTKLTTSKDKRKITSILDEIKGPYLRSDEKDISGYRRKWHLYNVTRIDEKHVWRHRIVDFTNHTSVGELVGVIDTPSPNNEKNSFVMRGAFRGRKLILFGKVSGNEPHELYVIPKMEGVQFILNAGVVIYRTWDHTDGIYPIILSPNNIISSKKIGSITKKMDVEYLNKSWKENFDKKYEFFPEVEV